jgi:hypothetical protein
VGGAGYGRVLRGSEDYAVTRQVLLQAADRKEVPAQDDEGVTHQIRWADYKPHFVVLPSLTPKAMWETMHRPG